MRWLVSTSAVEGRSQGSSGGYGQDSKFCTRTLGSWLCRYSSSTVLVMITIHWAAAAIAPSALGGTGMGSLQSLGSA